MAGDTADKRSEQRRRRMRYVNALYKTNRKSMPTLAYTVLLTLVDFARLESGNLVVHMSGDRLSDLTKMSRASVANQINWAEKNKWLWRAKSVVRGGRWPHNVFGLTIPSEAMSSAVNRDHDVDTAEASPCLHGDDHRDHDVDTIRTQSPDIGLHYPNNHIKNCPTEHITPRIIPLWAVRLANEAPALRNRASEIAGRLEASDAWQRRTPDDPASEFLRYLRGYGVTFTKHEVLAGYRQYGLHGGAA